MSRFFLDIVTPAQSFPRQSIVSVNLPGAFGRLTVLADHEPTVCLLQEGTAEWIDPSGRKERWSIQSGLLAVEDNLATLLVENAQPLA